jgi:hypothetical protein
LYNNVAAVLWSQYMVQVMLFPVINVCPLSQYFPQYVCSVQHGCFLELLDSELSRYECVYFYYYLWLYLTSLYILRRHVKKHKYFCVRTILNRTYIIPAPRQIAPSQYQIPFSDPTVYTYFSSPPSLPLLPPCRCSFFVGKKVSLCPVFFVGITVPRHLQTPGVL